MSLQDKILNELKELYPDIPKLELDKIIDSEFRLIEKIVSAREVKVINCIHLGKFYPTGYRKRLEEQNKLKEKEDGNIK